jgi:hypothetical protein
MSGGSGCKTCGTTKSFGGKVNAAYECFKGVCWGQHPVQVQDGAFVLGDSGGSVSGSITWRDARKECARLGASNSIHAKLDVSLAYVRTYEDWKFIKGAEYTLSTTSKTAETWIGLNNIEDGYDYYVWTNSSILNQLDSIQYNGYTLSQGGGYINNRENLEGGSPRYSRVYCGYTDFGNEMMEMKSTSCSQKKRWALCSHPYIGPFLRAYQYQPNKGQVSCLNSSCPVGKHHSSSVKDPQTCDACEAGKYSNTAAEKTCKTCSFGMYQTLPGQTVCTSGND